jgi:hypothetical protein
VEETWTAKEAVHEIHTLPDYELASPFIDALIRDTADKTGPIEVSSLSRRLKRWRNEIIGWHKLRVTNRPPESMNNLPKRVKRAAFGFRSFRNYRFRALLYSSEPNWSLLPPITPR